MVIFNNYSGIECYFRAGASIGPSIVQPIRPFATYERTKICQWELSKVLFLCDTIYYCISRNTISVFSLIVLVKLIPFHMQKCEKNSSGPAIAAAEQEQHRPLHLLEVELVARIPRRAAPHGRAMDFALIVSLKVRLYSSSCVILSDWRCKLLTCLTSMSKVYT